MREVTDSFGTLLPTSGLQKKVVASEAFKFEDNVVVRGLQKHMCHSAATCENSISTEIFILQLVQKNS